MLDIVLFLILEYSVLLHSWYSLFWDEQKYFIVFNRTYSMSSICSFYPFYLMHLRSVLSWLLFHLGYDQMLTVIIINWGEISIFFLFHLGKRRGSKKAVGVFGRMLYPILLHRTSSTLNLLDSRMLPKSCVRGKKNSCFHCF